MSQDRYVLLDRDGVINHDSDDFIKAPEQWHALDGSLEAIALLNSYGYKVAVITNQSGLARGLFDQATLDSIHAKMRQLASEKGGKIAAIYVCPHAPDSDCLCRKPKPGLLHTFAAEHDVALADTVFIGDALRDIQAALAAGAQPILVKTGKGELTLAANPDLNIPIFNTLYDAACSLVSRQ
jgi:D-glycero-D-manno-heptose 1,7-bisphosphate phosphatase